MLWFMKILDLPSTRKWFIAIKMRQNRLRPGLRPKPSWGAHDAPLDPRSGRDIPSSSPSVDALSVSFSELAVPRSSVPAAFLVHFNHSQNETDVQRKKTYKLINRQTELTYQCRTLHSFAQNSKWGHLASQPYIISFSVYVKLCYRIVSY